MNAYRFLLPSLPANWSAPDPAPTHLTLSPAAQDQWRDASRNSSRRPARELVVLTDLGLIDERNVLEILKFKGLQRPTVEDCLQAAMIYGGTLHPIPMVFFHAAVHSRVLFLMWKREKQTTKLMVAMDFAQLRWPNYYSVAGILLQ